MISLRYDVYVSKMYSSSVVAGCLDDDFSLVDDSVRLSILGSSELVRSVDEDALSSILLALLSLDRLDEWLSWLMFFLDVLNSKYNIKCFSGHEIKLQLFIVC
jgi:hypothetical protein